MDKTLLLRAVASSQDALLTINGLVVGKLHAGKTIRLPVHEFIQAGDNRIVVQLLDQPKDVRQSSLLAKDCSVNLWVELQKDRGPATWVEAQVLFAFNEQHASGQRLPKNRLMDVCVNLPVSFPRWRCFDLMHSSSSQADVLHVEDYVCSLLELIRGKKIDTFLSCFLTRNRELAIAYGIDLQQVQQQFSKHWRQVLSTGTLREESLNPSAWRIHAVRKAAVYALLDTSHEPLFQFQLGHSDTTIHLPMHVGVVGGEVFVVR